MAALSVVLWHWSAFPSVSNAGASFEVSSQPFYNFCFPFYLEGFRAVDLFFCLSGFVFYWLYSTKIALKQTSAEEFALLRFSRLYPLHFLTLLVMAGGQWYMRSAHGFEFVHTHNDLKHFVLQLFMASNWGFESGFSFNAPIWSVSIEVLLYGCFFCMCRLRLIKVLHLVLAMLAGLYICVFVSAAIGVGATGFFAGCLAAWVWLRIPPQSNWLLFLVILCLLLWILIPLNARHLYLLHLYENSPIKFTVMAGGRDVVSSTIERMCGYTYQTVLFPMTILCLALWERRLTRSLKSLAWLGNLSYASYLWHLPLQLAFFAVALHLGGDWRLFMTPGMLLLFFAVLILISVFSFSCIEQPAQKWIRNVWKDHRRRRGTSTGVK